MNEYDSTPYLTNEVEENVIDLDEVPQLPGLCSECLGSGYKIRRKDGIFGVLFTSTSEDSEGKPIRRLVPCECKVQVDF
jgi:hypothetical protein